MWHNIRDLWKYVEDQALSFRNQFIAGGVAGCGILLRVSPPDTLTIITAAWVLTKAAGIGAATAMGGWVMKSMIKSYLRYRKKKKHERHKRAIADGRKKECA